MSDKSNLKQNEVEIFTKVINEYIALQTSSSLSTLLSEPINYNVMILDKRFFNPHNIKLSSEEIQMCGVRLRGKGDIHIEICYAIKTKYAKMVASKLLGNDEIDEEVKNLIIAIDQTKDISSYEEFLKK